LLRRYHSSGIRAFALWALLMTLLAVPWGLRLGPFRPDHLAIVLFIPAAALLGGGVVGLADWAAQHTRPWVANLGLALLVMWVVGWGAWNTRAILNPVTLLADAADAQAIEWLAENTPADARFFANTTIWQYNTYRGVDGGYWITPLTRRFSLAMPGLYGYAAHDTVLQWQAWMEAGSHLKSCNQDFWALIGDADLDYIYLHANRGSLQPTALEGCAGVELIYKDAEVYIYKITKKVG